MSIRSYVRSTDCNGVSHRQNILGCVDIPVVVRPAVGAIPFPDIQRQLFNNVTAMPTALRTREPSVNLHQGSTVPKSFIFQLPHQFSPCCITDGTGEFGILDPYGFASRFKSGNPPNALAHHVLNCQILNHYRLVFTNQSGCQFVAMVFSGVRNLSLNPSYFESCFVSVARSFLFATQRLLRFSQLLIVLVKRFGVSNLFTRTQGNKATNPNGTKKSYKLYRISTTAFNAIEQLKMT